ncbi:hypothetical protein CCAX7_18260 [Capsulimonas corticalis]|uniref:Uncharacterized protein n=1 Tax=Capsulimonas corticalis TaxID=2219043 RepID=A0A402D5E5_9BACT|nr:hypothetical protein [Capsulimonas corticalis]BDI29775.1 hypothetical protein CCAX7_18260 [Capsulimonas corticalis]
MKIFGNKRALTSVVAALALVLIGISSLLAPQDVRLMQAGCACGRTLRWLEPAGGDHTTQYRLEVVAIGDPKHVHEYDPPQTIGIEQTPLWRLWRMKRSHEHLFGR